MRIRARNIRISWGGSDRNYRHPAAPVVPPQPPGLVVLRSIFPAKASSIDVAENTAIIDFIIAPVTIRENLSN